MSGGPYFATSGGVADVDAPAGASALRCIDRGGLRARTDDHHSGVCLCVFVSVLWVLFVLTSRCPA